MHVEADTARCEGHGLCAATSPDVFDLDDDAVVVVKIAGELTADLIAMAEDGTRVCPVAALRLVP
jgi:ferredoxin